jgi:hypothetical protein
MFSPGQSSRVLMDSSHAVQVNCILLSNELHMFLSWWTIIRLCMNITSTSFSYKIQWMKEIPHAFTEIDTVTWKKSIILATNIIYWRSQLPRSLRRGSTSARLLGLWVWIPLGTWITVSCGCCVLSGVGLCDGLISSPEESCRVCELSNREASIMGRPLPTRGCWATEENNNIIYYS